MESEAVHLEVEPILSHRFPQEITNDSVRPTFVKSTEVSRIIITIIFILVIIITVHETLTYFFYSVGYLRAKKLEGFFTIKPKADYASEMVVNYDLQRLMVPESGVLSRQ